jgi:hypothetical protein
MNKFIKEHIDSYNGKKYSIKNEIQSFEHDPLYLYIKILDNKVIANNPPNQFYNRSGFLDRKNRIIKMIQNSIKLNKINNTEFVIHIYDSYNWKHDIPIFNFNLPLKYKGLIFPHFDFIKFNTNFDKIKTEIYNYNPKTIVNNIYYNGINKTDKINNIRFLLSKLKEPFNIILKEKNVPVYTFKQYKYLLDLPGTKPWTEIFKYMCLCERVIIKISFYNSKFEEKGYWQDLTNIYIRENIDYIHLKYDVDYDKPLSKIILNKIIKDIENVYYKFEANPILYTKMINNLKKSADKLSLNNVYEYISKIINLYTKNLLIN